MNDVVPDSALVRGRLAGLDGARGAACVCVVFAHATAFFGPTAAGGAHLYLSAQMVVLFFTLSGFLIFLPFCRLAAVGRLPRLRRYAGQRIRRVFPAYIVAFAITNALGLVYVANAVERGVPGTDAATGRIAELGLFLRHLTLVQNLFPSEFQTGLNPSWSLTTELCFYLVLPVAGVALVTLNRAGIGAARMILPGAAFVLVGWLAKTVLDIDQRSRSLSFEVAQFGSDPAAVLTRSLLGQADTFGWGMIVAGIFVAMERGRLTNWSGSRLWWALGLAWVLAMAGTLWSVKSASHFDGAFFSMAVAAFMLAALEPSARGRESRLGRVADTWPLRQVGDISLSVYLWHYPIMIGLARAGFSAGDTLGGALLGTGIVLTAAVAIGWLSWRCVEQPFMRGRRRTQTTAS